MSLGTLAGIMVGAVLVISGAAKLADRRWQDREIQLGSPKWILPFLPYVEIVIGALVAVRVQRIVIGAIAVGLFAVFTIFLLVKWDERKGEPCNCLGMLSTRPASKKTILRNLALLSLAVAAAAVK